MKEFRIRFNPKTGRFQIELHHHWVPWVWIVIMIPEEDALVANVDLKDVKPVKWKPKPMAYRTLKEAQDQVMRMGITGIYRDATTDAPIGNPGAYAKGLATQQAVNLQPSLIHLPGQPA